MECISALLSGCGDRIFHNLLSKTEHENDTHDTIWAGIRKSVAPQPRWDVPELYHLFSSHNVRISIRFYHLLRKA